MNPELPRPCFPHPPQCRPLRPFGVAATLVLLAATLLPAQTLARPGWVGSGLTVERWWRHAVLLDVPATATLPNPDQLDTLRSLGIDALLLRNLPATPNPANTNPAGNPDPASANTPAGNPDDLLREASRRSLRVLIELPANPSPATVAATARSWAARGAAGFLLPPATTPETLRSLRSALRAIPGERLLISTAPSTLPADLQLTPIAGLAPQSVPSQLLAALTALPSAPVTPLLTAGPTSPDLARVAAATVLLTAPGASLLANTKVLPDTAPNPTSRPVSSYTPADQLRQFTALHHDRPAFLTGPLTPLDHTPESAAVWLRRGPTGATFVVVCNLRPTPLRLSLADDLARLHLRGTFLKTVSRSDPGLGAMPLTAVTLPPFGVYIGELSR